MTDEIINVEWDASRVLSGIDQLITRLGNAETGLSKFKQSMLVAEQGAAESITRITQGFAKLERETSATMRGIDGQSLTRITNALTGVKDLSTATLGAVQAVAKFRNISRQWEGGAEGVRTMTSALRQFIRATEDANDKGRKSLEGLAAGSQRQTRRPTEDTLNERRTPPPGPVSPVSPSRQIEYEQPAWGNQRLRMAAGFIYGNKEVGAELRGLETEQQKKTIFKITKAFGGVEELIDALAKAKSLADLLNRKVGGGEAPPTSAQYLMSGTADPKLSEAMAKAFGIPMTQVPMPSTVHGVYRPISSGNDSWMSSTGSVGVAGQNIGKGQVAINALDTAENKAYTGLHEMGHALTDLAKFSVEQQQWLGRLLANARAASRGVVLNYPGGVQDDDSRFREIMAEAFVGVSGTTPRMLENVTPEFKMAAGTYFTAAGEVAQANAQRAQAVALLGGVGSPSASQAQQTPATQQAQQNIAQSGNNVAQAINTAAQKITTAAGGAGGVGGGGGNPPSAPPGFGGIGDSAKGAGENVNSLSAAFRKNKTDGDSNKLTIDSITASLQRHVGWIIQSQIIWGGMRFVTDSIKRVVDQYLALEDAIIRVGIASGRTRESVSQSIVQEGITGAQYGIDPSTAIRANITAIRANVDPETLEQARRAVVMFGGDYQNVMAEFVQTNNKARASGIQYIDVLNYLATASRHVATNSKDAAGDMEVYFDALQAAIPIAPRLGVGVEQLGISLGKIAFTSEVANAKTAGTYVETFLKNIESASARRKLRIEFGIDEDTIQDRAKAVLDLMNSYISSGDQTGVQNLLNAVTAGTVSGPQQRNEMVSVLSQLGVVMSGQEEQIGGFDQAFSEMTDSTLFKTKQLTAAWEAYTQALSQTSWVDGVVGAVDKVIDAFTFSGMSSANMTQQGNRFDALTQEQRRAVEKRIGSGNLAYQDAFGSWKSTEQLNEITAQQFGGGLGGEVMAASPWGTDVKRAVIAQLLKEAIDAEAGIVPGVSNGTNGIPSSGAGAQVFAASSTPPTPVDRLINLPEDVTVEQFEMAMSDAIAELGKIPGYTGDEIDSTVALMDAQDKYQKVLDVSSEAASIALKNLAEKAKAAEDAFKMFGGINDLPEGQTFEETEAGARKWERRLKEELPEEYSKPLLEQKDVYFTVDGHLRKMTVSLEALRLSNSEMLKLQKENIKGIFNVPDEGRALIPFFALQQGFVPDDMLPGAGGAANGAGTESWSAMIVDDMNATATAATVVTTSFNILQVAAHTTAAALTSITSRDSVLNDPARNVDPGRGQMYRDADRENRYAYGQDSPGGGYLATQLAQIDNNITVTVDGQLVAQSVNRKNYRNLNSVRRTAGVASGGSSKAMLAQ